VGTRGGHDWTDRFPAIAKAAKRLGVPTAIHDGEAVVLDEQGRFDFGLLQQSLGGRGGTRTSNEAIFMAFDLLYFDGHDLRKLEFTARRHLLEGLIKIRDDVIRLSEEIEADGDRLFLLPASTALRASSRKTVRARTAPAGVATGKRLNASRATASRSSAMSILSSRGVESAHCCSELAKHHAGFDSEKSLVP
jgi:bifunctional non-homologous end joining protein LigD